MRPPRPRDERARHVLLPTAREPRHTPREHATSPSQKTTLPREQPLARRLASMLLSASCLHPPTSTPNHMATSRGPHRANEGSQNAYHPLHPWPNAHSTLQRRRLASDALSSKSQHICTSPTHSSANIYTRTARHEDHHTACEPASANAHIRTPRQTSALHKACTCSNSTAPHLPRPMQLLPAHPSAHVCTRPTRRGNHHIERGPASASAHTRTTRTPPTHPPTCECSTPTACPLLRSLQLPAPHTQYRLTA